MKPRHAALVCGWALCGASAAWAQTGGAATAGGVPATFDAVVEAPRTPPFELKIDAPDDIRALIERHSVLQRFRELDDLDAAELERVRVMAQREIEEWLGTLGHFNPVVDLQWGTDPTPPRRLTMRIEPGPRTRVDAVNIQFKGHIANASDKPFVEQRDDVQSNWSLKPPAWFTQDDWTRAKTDALRRLVVLHYPAATLADSRADVDADASTAKLGVTLDSGPLYRFGSIVVKGAQRYPEHLAPRLAQVPVGEVYSQRALLDAQQRLTGSGYYDAAFVSIDPDSPPDAARVNMQLTEAPLQKITAGVGYSTDQGPRFTLEHRHNRVPGIDGRVTTKLKAEQRNPSIEVAWLSLPSSQGWRAAGMAKLERLRDADYATTTQTLRFGALRSVVPHDINVYLQYDRSRVSELASGANVTAADVGQGSAISGNLNWTWRAFEPPEMPAKGQGLSTEWALGMTLDGPRRPFGRALVRYLRVLPISPAQGRVALRAEVGGVFAADDAQVPSSYLFRTGGDNSVRGYAWRSIGIEQGNLINPGRYLSVLSAEWQRPILQSRFPNLLEQTLFVDAGAVADRVADLKPQLGVGTGLRVRSPIGPIQLDVGYGLASKRIRLHMGVGFVF